MAVAILGPARLSPAMANQREASRVRRSILVAVLALGAWLCGPLGSARAALIAPLPDNFIASMICYRMGDPGAWCQADLDHADNPPPLSEAQWEAILSAYSTISGIRLRIVYAWVRQEQNTTQPAPPPLPQVAPPSPAPSRAWCRVNWKACVAEYVRRSGGYLPPGLSSPAAPSGGAGK